MNGKVFIYALFTLSALLYTYIAYYFERSNFLFLGGVVLLLFSIYVFAYKKIILLSKQEIIATGFFFRLLFLFSVPALSNDYVRFIWDGQLITNGYSPYFETPQQVILNFDKSLFLKELLSSMNSPNYYSVYPPLNQLFYFIAASFGAENILINIVIMRLFILLSEIGSILLLFKLNLPSKSALLYFLNPLIIIELCGNLHFEGVMIFFIITSFYFLKKNRFHLSAIFLGLAISVKLIPFIFLPFIVLQLKFKRGVQYAMLCFIVVLALFLPFISKELIYHFGNSLQLYFLTFEFNASIYYLVRELGFVIYNYNIISTLGKLLPACTLLIMFIILFKQYKVNTQEKLYTSLLFALFTYYMLSSVVHPWYISSLIVLGIFSNYVFPIIWSCLIFLSYHAYENTITKENMYFVITEYVILVGFLLYEIKKEKRLLA